VRQGNRRAAAFTLAEVLAALMFMAIVIPVAVEALHLASVSGQIAVRKAEAARIAANVLSESVVTTNWNRATASTIRQSGREYQCSLRSDSWVADAGLQLLTADVSFSTQGRQYTVSLSTLVEPQTFMTPAGLQ
jgi:hypothetical protein